jgi:hypothetical protein
MLGTTTHSQTLNALPNGKETDSELTPTEGPTKPGSTEKKYDLEDFSQSAINRGQQRINYELTVVNDRIGDALQQLRNAVKQLASCGQVDLQAIDDAIKAVSHANRKVAGYYPPGCYSPGSGTPQT